MKLVRLHTSGAAYAYVYTLGDARLLFSPSRHFASPTSVNLAMSPALSRTFAAGNTHSHFVETVTSREFHASDMAYSGFQLRPHKSTDFYPKLRTVRKRFPSINAGKGSRQNQTTFDVKMYDASGYMKVVQRKGNLVHNAAALPSPSVSVRMSSVSQKHWISRSDMKNAIPEHLKSCSMNYWQGLLHVI